MTISAPDARDLPPDAGVGSAQAAAELLFRTQSSLALAMRGGRMGWWTRDLVTEVVTWSPELEELFGLPAGSFGGRESLFLDLVHDDDRPAVSAAVADAIANGSDYTVEFRFRHADGSWRWMDGRGRATYVDGRPVMLYGIGMDITERTEAEAAVRMSEERLRIAADVAGFGLFDVNLATADVYWSPELRRMLGWGDTEPAVRNALQVHPDDREETDVLRAASQDPLGDGSFDHEYRIVLRDESVRWIAVHGQTFFDAPEPAPDRRPVRTVGVVNDVTERRQAEEIRDVFVGMLSHELRTPVTAIFGGSQLLRRPNLDEVSRREIIEDIVTESERLERLVENLLVLARAERHVVEGGRDPVLVRPLVERIVADKRRKWPTANIVVDAPAGLPPARWDEASFELVLRNLISNAIKYGPEGGEILVGACLTDNEIEVTVRDAGPGLPADQPERLFELFFRTDDARQRAQGAGIGLFVVRALVESVGGTSWARNRPTGGAEFGIRLRAFVEGDDDSDLD